MSCDSILGVPVGVLADASAEATTIYVGPPDRRLRLNPTEAGGLQIDGFSRVSVRARAEPGEPNNLAVSLPPCRSGRACSSEDEQRPQPDARHDPGRGSRPISSGSLLCGAM